MNALELVRLRLAEVTGWTPPTERGDWRCPAHADGNPSLSVNPGASGVVLLHCQAGCSVDEVLAALKLRPADLFDRPPAKERSGRPRIVATYDYVDESGTLIFQVVRYEPKGFKQRRPNGAGGWEWTLTGTRRVLYRLPQVIAAVDDGRRIWIVEGEKDVHALEQLGEVATCNAGGGGRGKWARTDLSVLAGADVIIVRDRDSSGMHWAADLEAALAGLALTVTVVEAIPDHKGADASDHLAAGHGVDDFMLVEDVAPAASDPIAAAPAPPPPGGAERDTEGANARRLVSAYGHELRYVSTWGQWLVWDGRRWRKDTKGEVVERAKAIAAALWADVAVAEDRKRAAAWATKTESAHGIEAMIRLARTDPVIAVDPDELDRDRWALNVRNGTIDLRTGQLRPHDPARLITRLADVDYHPNTLAPRWVAFLEQILPDADVREFVARWCGYCLTGDITEQKTVFAIGPGSNGKGTLFNTLAAILGDYAGQAAPDLLLRQHNDPHPAGQAELHGRRLVLAAETGEGRRLDEPLLKRLTGGDRIKARQLYRDWFEFDPTHKFVVATNHRPGIDGTDHAIWRRIRLVPFTVTIPESAQDKHLDDKLAAEAAGILAWAVAGGLRWQQSGLTEPLAVTIATDDYRAEMDPLGDFLEECCHLASGLSARAGDLHATYQRWAEAAGHRAITATKLGRELSDRGLLKRKSNGVWWDGIGLRTDPRTDRLDLLGGRSE